MRIEIPGYTRFRVGRARVTALVDSEHALREALRQGTLYEYAGRHPDRRQMKGRGDVFAAPLPGQNESVVVRHAFRGGAPARLTRDLFIPPTRGLRELLVSQRLRAAGVSTPEVVAYVTYPAGAILRRFDIATREIPNGADLFAWLAATEDEGARDVVLNAAAGAVASLGSAGAHHPDLNIRNVLVAPGGDGGLTGWILDVDRVRFHVPGSPTVRDANLTRLRRSLRKSMRLGLPIREEEITAILDRVLELTE
ncbi:MAG TPA: lipopolysaccharide kinase InaA family protein [Gemmatimonadaceae bacterium]|nr:lipopolysaccharide kinase InaA family protein [Gemmatimonadaceae bacterium]